ncbi:MAG: hypothetical protein ACOX2M_03920 [Fastidiosipilaceae bacterium]|jgi:hypothetical protein
MNKDYLEQLNNLCKQKIKLDENREQLFKQINELSELIKENEMKSTIILQQILLLSQEQ